MFTIRLLLLVRVTDMSVSPLASDCIGEKLAPFNPSSDEVVDLALDYLDLNSDTDTLIDLGCGDGRLLITAAIRSRDKKDKIRTHKTNIGNSGNLLNGKSHLNKYQNRRVDFDDIQSQNLDPETPTSEEGNENSKTERNSCTNSDESTCDVDAVPDNEKAYISSRLLPCIGVEYDGKFALRAKESVQQRKQEFIDLDDQITIIHGNALEVNLEILQVNKVFVYLVPSGLKLMEPKLRQVLEGGGRVVSYMFSITNFKPIKKGHYKGTKVRLYTKDSL